MIIMTPYEYSIFEHAKEGKTAKEIAELIYRDSSTVRSRLRSIVGKGILKKEKGTYFYTGVPFEVGNHRPGPEPWINDDKVWLTPKQAQVYELLLTGTSGTNIRKKLDMSGGSLTSYYTALVARGMLNKIGYNQYEVIHKPYKIEKKPTIGYNKELPAFYTQDVPQDILDYVKANYNAKKRGELARKLNITRTMLNQIAIEHGLAKGG